jgi:hypothetical protein
VKPAASALLHSSFINLFSEVLDLAHRTGIRVSVARGQRSAGGVDSDQRRGEGVHGYASDTLTELGRGGQARDQLGDICDSLLRIQLDCPVSSRIELMGKDVIQPFDCRRGGVVDSRPAAGRSDVDHKHKWVLGFVELNVDRHICGSIPNHLQNGGSESFHRQPDQRRQLAALSQESVR